MSSIFLDDDIDEDHFLVRKHLHRYSFGDSLKSNQTRSSFLLHRPQLSSVIKKPIIFPPFKKNDQEHSFSQSGVTTESGQTNKLIEINQNDSLKSPSNFIEISDVIKKDSESELERSPKPNFLTSPQISIDSSFDYHGSDCQVSTPDSSEDLEFHKRLDDDEFRKKNESDVTNHNVTKPPNSNRLSKIISYDEALNIPQTDDDKERMTTSRRKERPSNLIINTPVRPMSAFVNNRRQLSVIESLRKESFLGSLQSLNSSSGTLLTPDVENQDFLRRTQSFRGSRSIGGGKRTTMGCELVNHIQENAKTISSKFENLSAKDQKVLAVLMAKREREKEEERMKDEMNSLWEAEKYVRDKSRLSLNHPNETQCPHKTTEDCINESCPVYRSLVFEERKQNENRLKLQQALERKKRVEQRLEEQKKRHEDHSKEIIEKQQQQLERAVIIKKEKHEQIKMKMFKQNETTKQKFEQIKSKRLTEQELLKMEENMKANLYAAELKAKKLKEEEASKIAKKLQLKVDKAQQIQRNMEKEMDNWQEQAITYRQQQERHAEELQAIQLAQKKESLMKTREAKEKAQKQNLQRILERDKEWRSSLEASILTKDERRKLLNQEKESLLQKSRAQSQMTRRLREELNLNQSLTDLDKLSKYVDLQRKILN